MENYIHARPDHLNQSGSCSKSCGSFFSWSQSIFANGQVDENCPSTSPSSTLAEPILPVFDDSPTPSSSPDLPGPDLPPLPPPQTSFPGVIGDTSPSSNDTQPQSPPVNGNNLTQAGNATITINNAASSRFEVQGLIFKE